MIDKQERERKTIFSEGCSFFIDSVRVKLGNVLVYYSIYQIYFNDKFIIIVFLHKIGMDHQVSSIVSIK